ncbi:hypothetical protein QQS21_007133 [Conoideocrella luteorostrata]|uniref:Uncharacterized protein n=1 Tax=Conoideocrella luteorostrata TaxID=1105319 RepID=A0AAJ0CNS5_9HYPO|nr:hypothetical protein QQS21_007133 [Conoideocrella luteorostrata]
MADLHKGERSRFPNLCEFLDGKGAACDGKSRIRCIRFTDGKGPDFPQFEEILSAAASATAEIDEKVAETAEVMVIENADVRTLQLILENKVSGEDRPSFLRFLDSYLHDQPSFNFDDIQRQLSPMPSVLNKQQFVSFSYATTREFDRPFTLGYEEIEHAGKRAGSWRTEHTWGPMNPVQRYDSYDTRTAFPPVAITRTRAAAWFGRDSARPWSLGIILLDEVPKFAGLPGRLKPSGHRIGDEWYFGYDSSAELLFEAMKRNANLQLKSVPSPILVAQDLYRLIGFEWLLFTSYHARDLNAIEWALQYGGGADGTIRPEMLTLAMRDLFMSRRRVPLYVNQVRDQLSSCQPSNRRLWDIPLDHTGRAVAEATKTASDELIDDFTQLERLMTQLHERLDASMAHITGQTNILEAQRTHELNQMTVEQNKIAFAQNKILLALALVGTFFLPINAIAAIFSMGGSWAAGERLFGIFWAICIPTSLGLVAALLLFMYYGTTRDRARKDRSTEDTCLV